MSNETKIIIRHSEPNMHDESPHGTACKVLLDNKYDLYIQINKHEKEKPSWFFVGTFSNEVDDDFIMHEVKNILGK